MYQKRNRTYDSYAEIYSFVQGDVNGDGIVDNIYLIGNETSDSPFVQNITLEIQDGRTGIYTDIELSDNAGYNPKLYLMDFTGDGIADILVSITSGGSGGIMYYYVYSFQGSTPQLMFDFNAYNEQYTYAVTYLDYYKVEVTSQLNNKSYLIDLSDRDPEYLNEIYDAEGRLINPIEGFVNPLSGLYPIDYDANYVYDLLAYQKIAGRYNADALGYFMNSLSWKDGRFKLDNQSVAIN